MCGFETERCCQEILGLNSDRNKNYSKCFCYSRTIHLLDPWTSSIVLPTSAVGFDFLQASHSINFKSLDKKTFYILSKTNSAVNICTWLLIWGCLVGLSHLLWALRHAAVIANSGLHLLEEQGLLAEGASASSLGAAFLDVGLEVKTDISPDLGLERKITEIKCTTI